jgi:hypothetical protein
MMASLGRTFATTGRVMPHALVIGGSGSLAFISMDCETEPRLSSFASDVADVANAMPDYAATAIVAEGWARSAECDRCTDPRRCRHSLDELAARSPAVEVVTVCLTFPDGGGVVLTAQIRRSLFGAASLEGWTATPGSFETEASGRLVLNASAPSSSVATPSSSLEVN